MMFLKTDTQSKAVMTNQERRRLKAQLIEASLWNADEAGDPTIEEDAAKELERRASEKAGVRFEGFTVAAVGSVPPSTSGITVYRGGEELLRVTGNTPAEAICFAAVALTALL